MLTYSIFPCQFLNPDVCAPLSLFFSEEKIHGRNCSIYLTVTTSASLFMRINLVITQHLQGWCPILKFFSIFYLDIDYTSLQSETFIVIHSCYHKYTYEATHSCLYHELFSIALCNSCKQWFLRVPKQTALSQQ